MFKTRYRKSHSSVLAHRNDQLLIAANIKRQSFKWLNKMGFSNSYNIALAKNKKLAANHDQEVIEWKERIENGHFDIEYQTILDNLDKEVRVRHQSTNNLNKSFHWVHVMAAISRTHSSQDTRSLEEYQTWPILPNEDSITKMRTDFMFLIKRSIVQNIPAFSIFKKDFKSHLDHQFTAEMSQKSQIVPCGLIFESENKSSGMSKILRTIQDRYVPVRKNGDETEILQSIPTGGDLLTWERGENVKRSMLDGENDFDRINGLELKFEDWHLKKTLYEVKDKIFRDEASGSEFGTTAWSMNVLSTSNAKKGPHKAMNAYSEFSEKELHGQIAAMVMEICEMQKFEDDPIPDDIKESNEKMDWLDTLATIIIERYVSSYNADKIQPTSQPTIPSIKIYLCYKRKTGECRHNPFKTLRGRNNHEVNVHQYERATEDETEQAEVDFRVSESKECKDFILSYQRSLFTLNLVLHNITDAIKEGDGERLMNAYRFALVYFRATGHTKYAYAMVQMFSSIRLRPQSAFKLIWGRFINTSGIRGRNISQDLHLEHLNRFLKDLLKNLGTNQDKKNAERIAHSVKNLRKIVENYETSNSINKKYNSNKRQHIVDDVKKLAEAMCKAKLFSEHLGREYESFPRFNESLMTTQQVNNMHRWLKEREREFKRYTLLQYL